MADKITLDIALLQGVFGDLQRVQQQLSGISGGMAALDRTVAGHTGNIQNSFRGVNQVLGTVESTTDGVMRNMVADILAPISKAQALQDKLGELNNRLRMSRSVSEIGKLKAEITGVQRELDRVNASGAEQRIAGPLSRVRSMLGGLAAPLAGAFAVSGVMAFSNGVVQAAADAQSFGTSMEVMLKSKERADALTAQVTQFAGSTPFELGQLRNATTQLLAYQVSADQVIPTLENLGNIAAGVGMDKLPQLMTAFGQVKAAGKLTGGELKQFTEAGVPLLDELAKITGKSTAQMAGNIANMAIPFNTVQQALKNLSTGNGIFANLMQRQSLTIGGQISNMSDSWNKFKEDMGMALAPQIGAAIEWLKGALDGLRTAFAWVQANSDTIITVIKAVAIAMGIYTTALLINNRQLIYNQALQLISKGVLAATAVATNLVTAATTLWTGAQWLLNAALSANPIGIVILAIGALVAAVVWLVNHWDAATAYLGGMWESWKIGFNGLLDTVRIVFNGIVDIVQGAWKMIQAQFTTGTESAKLQVQGMLQMQRGFKGVTTDAAASVVSTAAKAKAAEMQGVANAFVAEAKARAAEEVAKGTAGGGAQAVSAAGNVGAAELLGGGTKAGAATGDGKGVTVGGGNGGGDRNISMNITINMPMKIDRDVDASVGAITEKVATLLTNRLRDAEYALG